MAVEAAFGKDFMTDEELSKGERFICAVGAIPGVGKLLKKTAQAIRTEKKLANSAQVAAKLEKTALEAEKRVSGGATGFKGKPNSLHSLQVGEFKYTKTAGNHANDIVKRGKHKGEAARPYMNSPNTIKEVMSAGKGIKDPGGVPGALRYDIPGNFRGSSGKWELVIDPKTNTIYHFNFVN